MEFVDVIANRHSVRKYTREGVDSALVERILRAANSAPSAGNLQAYQIYLVRDGARRQTLARAGWGQDFVAAAPIVLVFCAVPWRSERKYRARGRSLYCLQDATIACAYAQLAATAEGLGAVWVGAFDEEEVKRALDLTADEVPVAFLAIGHSAETPFTTTRRNLDDLVEEI